MLRHIVMRSFVPGVTGEQIAAVEANTRRFLEVEGVLAVEIGVNLHDSPRAEGLTHITTIALRDAEALQRLMVSAVRTDAVSFAQSVTQRAIVAELQL